jgi:hypothetical protein
MRGRRGGDVWGSFEMRNGGILIYLLVNTWVGVMREGFTLHQESWSQGVGEAPAKAGSRVLIVLDISKINAGAMLPQF